MITLTENTLQRMVNDGDIEIVTEPTIGGYAEIRWLETGKRETIRVY